MWLYGKLADFKNPGELPHKHDKGLCLAVTPEPSHDVRIRVGDDGGLAVEYLERTWVADLGVEDIPI